MSKCDVCIGVIESARTEARANFAVPRHAIYEVVEFGSALNVCQKHYDALYKGTNTPTLKLGDFEEL